MRLSCPEQMLKERPFAEKLEIVKRAGFDGFDARFTTVDAPDTVEIVRNAEFPLVSVYSQVRTPSLLEPGATDRAQAVVDIVDRARRAAELGARNLIVVPVFGPSRITGIDSVDELITLETSLLIDGLKQIGQELADVDITVVMEPLNKDETHFLTRPTMAAEICDTVGSPRIATMVDTYHCHREQLDSADEVAQSRRHLALLHYSDSARGLPGEGDVAFSAVTTALEDMGYEGWIGFECRKIATDEDERALAESVNFVRATASQQ